MASVSMLPQTQMLNNNNTMNPSMSPEAAMSANNGTMTGGMTTSQTPAATSLQGGGASSPVARDAVGSKLVEGLQGAKTTQLEEVANRGAASGYSGGQLNSMLNKANRDYMLGMSQGLGQFNIDRLNQAANINRDFLGLELQRQLGLGNLELGSQSLNQQMALRLSELAQYADQDTKNRIMLLMQQYFGGGVL